MRYLVGFMCVLALLVALPQRVAAQTGEKAATSAASAVHARHHLPRQLMLRASYYLYLDAHVRPDQAQCGQAPECTGGWGSRNLRVKPRGTCVRPRTRE